MLHQPLQPAFTIDSNNCVECGQCRRFCPLKGAIIINDDYQHEIVSDACSGCGLCVAFCPVPGAIKLTGITDPVILHPQRLKLLRRVVWRSKWLFHDHRLMGPLTLKARIKLRTAAFKRRQSHGQPAFAAVA
jgi:Pyruvate/2-oxoacid:ferredoxin oxidoreductase delta subunit